MVATGFMGLKSEVNKNSSLSVYSSGTTPAV